MKISRISPFVVAPAPDNDVVEDKLSSKKKVLKTASASAHSKDNEASSEAVSELEFARRKREEEKRKEKEKHFKNKKGLKSYERFINEDAEDLMKNNFKRKG